VFFACTLTGTTLEDIHYSIKQNGIMINLDYAEPIDDDDIIGWKSDRGWVYLTLLGVRAPRNKQPQDTFNGVVKKIVIDDFDESTQLAILISKPVLGYDIINSKTSPSTVIFIHTEMRKSEVANLKRHIDKTGTSVFNVAKSSGFPKFNTNFKNAFDEARKKLGPNSIFEFHGKLYTTNHPGEKESGSRSAFMEKSVAPVLDGEFKDFTLRNIDLTSSMDTLVEEIYVDRTTGATITELIGDSVKVGITDSDNNMSQLILVRDDTLSGIQPQAKEDDGWFSGKLPAYKKTKSQSPLHKEMEKPLDSLIQKTRPVLVESLNDKKKNKRAGWRGVLGTIFKKKDQVKDSIVLEEQSLAENDKELITPEKETKAFAKTYDSPSVELLESHEYGRLQKKYIPRQDESIIAELEHDHPQELSETQTSDSTIVSAWFMDESTISDEFDSRRLQKQYIPSIEQNMIFELSDDLVHNESIPQQQKNIDPDILNNETKIRYSNDNIAKKLADEDNSVFDTDIVDNNSWLSYFPTQNDSVIESLKWDFQEEREVPKFLQSERESIDYSSNDNGKYLWRDNLPEDRPKSFPPRQSDPGFMYYHNGGIRVDANMDGIPIYIDGKYVGETPLSRPIQVEPGWHQVSGFSPVYTHLAFRKGLQFVGYDSIIQNNELFGSTTVYAEAGKLETVELKFNQMGDTPKKLNEINGGMNIGTPILLFLMGLIMWGMG